MSIRNVILGFLAITLAVTSAIASAMNAAVFRALRSDGLATKTFSSIQTITCPQGTAKNCLVKLVTSAGYTTILGYSAATVLTVSGTVIKTDINNTVLTVVIPN